MSAATYPDVPAVRTDLVGFEAGEDVGERAGRCAERRDAIAYLARKRANALRIVERQMDVDDYAAHTARACTILIGDIAGGLHEGDGFNWSSAALAECGEPAPAGRPIAEPYPFRQHRTLAEADADAGAAIGESTQMGEG